MKRIKSYKTSLRNNAHSFSNALILSHLLVRYFTRRQRQGGYQ